MAGHAKSSDRTGIKVYVADSRSPLQRGINENTNGVLRHHLSQGPDLPVLSQQDLDDFAFDLNVRPRKSVGWKCPLELLMPESFNYEPYFGKHVALRPRNCRLKKSSKVPLEPLWSIAVGRHPSHPSLPLSNSFRGGPSGLILSNATPTSCKRSAGSVIAQSRNAWISERIGSAE